MRFAHGAFGYLLRLTATAGRVIHKSLQRQPRRVWWVTRRALLLTRSSLVSGSWQMSSEPAAKRPIWPWRKLSECCTKPNTLSVSRPSAMPLFWRPSRPPKRTQGSRHKAHRTLFPTPNKRSRSPQTRLPLRALQRRLARGTKWFFASARDDGYWQRVILTVRHVAGGEYEDEAAVAVRSFTQLSKQLPGCMGVVYDGAFRGIHRDVLARLGLLVINRQHGSVKPRAYELLRYGRCRHDLWCDQGRIAERILLDDGTSTLIPVPVSRLEHRQGRTKSRWYHLLLVPCRRGAHPYRVQVGITTTPADRIGTDPATGRKLKSDTERDFHRAEYLQQIPESTLIHQQLYPYRSDSESVHNQFDQSLWNNRMISYGLERQKVFALGFALAQNATSRRIFLERSGIVKARRVGRRAA